MMKTIQKRNKLGTYLAVTAGVGCVASSANAAVVFYGSGITDSTNGAPLGITIATYDGPLGGYAYANYYGDYSRFSYDSASTTFTQGGDLVSGSFSGYSGSYSYLGNFTNGAQTGDHNFANISFDGDDFVYEAVGQFFFDGLGGGFLVAIATNNDISDPLDLSNGGGAALSISEGKALILAAAVPEPSSLALLALGAAGLISRRQRKAA